MATTDPIPAAPVEELGNQGPNESLTPKRKPLTTSTPRSNGETPKEDKADKAPPSSSKSKAAWPYPQHGPYDYRHHHPSMFSPPTYHHHDRSMQPPHHRAVPRSNNIDYMPHNSHHRPSDKPTQSSLPEASATASSSNDPNYPEPASMEEEMGADYLSLMPVGSFADDSPPRRKAEDKPRRSPRASPTHPSYPPYGYPPHHHHHHYPPPPPHPYYAKSPRSSSHASMYYGLPPKAASRHGEAPPPPHHYPYPPPPPGHHGYRYYPPYPPVDHWTSPQAYDTDFSEKENTESSNIKEAFRSSPEQKSCSSSPSPEAKDDDDDKTTTPEKSKMRSPFRSPPISQTKKSPFFRSPGLAAYGSFGMMDTPGGTLGADFSPMGPILGKDPFGTGYPTPPHLSLSRSSSDGNLEDGTESDPQLSNSPFSGFIRDFPVLPPNTATKVTTATSGGLQGVPRSPLLSEKRAALTKASEARADKPEGSASLPSSSRLENGSKIPASPLGTSGTKPRKLWNGPNEPGPVRLELGSTSSLKKSLDGINNMMRSSQPPPMATPSTGSRPPYSRLPPPANLSRLSTTPMKLEPSPVQTTKGPGMLSNKRGLPPSAKPSLRDAKVPRSADKENATTPSVKRNPCNCKKSRCLKLYCECFASEMFCDGCNCTDCQNSSDFSSVRDKAIKDTRAKNPNAFKPRISVKGSQGVALTGASPQSGHNMGCRCKRSECLKKYCECFQAGVICGAKCKCVDCMNFAGSQKLIDKRRKIKDQRGAENAMRLAQETWKGPNQHQHSARKLPVARPAVHSMHPMPSPMSTPSGRMPHGLPPHMMHPSPGHGTHPYMRPGYGHPWGFSPMHVSPSAYMYPPPPPPPVRPSSSSKASPTVSGGKSRKAAMVEMPYAKVIASSSSKKTPPPCNTDESEDEKSSSSSSGEESPREKPEVSVQPTPFETKTNVGTTITPSPAGPVRLAYVDKTKAETSPLVSESKVTASQAEGMTTTEAKASPSLEAFFGPTLPSLPKAEVTKILSILSGEDLKRAKCVCKGWNVSAQALN